MKNYFSLSLLSTLLFIFVSPIFAQQSESGDGFRFDTLAIVKTTPVKSQSRSGTCWSYSTTSFVETELIRLDGKEYDLSEMYFVNWAYRAKAVSYIQLQGKANFSPGGQAHDVMDVIRAHGFVTQDEYPGKIKGYDTDIHGELNNGLSAFLEAIAKKPDHQLSEAWFDGFVALLDAYMGLPPQPIIKSGFNADDYVELTSYTHHPFYEKFRLEVPDNWSFNANYYNLPIDELMQVIDNALQNGYSVVWDGDVSDRGFNHQKALAILPETDVEKMDSENKKQWQRLSKDERLNKLYAFESPVPEKKVDQEMRQMAFETQKVTDDHLMHLTGLLKDQNGTKYYVTKNSWGSDSNSNGGYLNMSEPYVRLSTIAIMVHKDAIPKAIRKKLHL